MAKMVSSISHVVDMAFSFLSLVLKGDVGSETT
jgi:hypothetical protein